MPISGGGVVSKRAASVAVANTTIQSSPYNLQEDDTVDSLNAMVQLSGLKAMTGNLPFGGFKATGLGVGTALTDAPTLGQVQSQVVSKATVVGGTVDAITLTMSPVTLAYAAGDVIRWTSAGVNTITAPTVNRDSLGVKTIKKGASAALVAGDTGVSGYLNEAIYNGTDFILQNPASGVASASTTVRGTVELSTAAEFLNDTADRALTGEFVWDAAAEVTLTDAATIAVDMSTFFNAIVTLAGNRTLGQPSNTKVGQSGVIRIVQDGTGSRTLAYHADWKFAGGTDPTLTTTASATDLLFYQVLAANVIYASLVKAIA